MRCESNSCALHFLCLSQRVISPPPIKHKQKPYSSSSPSSSRSRSHRKAHRDFQTGEVVSAVQERPACESLPHTHIKFNLSGSRHTTSPAQICTPRSEKERIVSKKNRSTNQFSPPTVLVSNPKKPKRQI